MWSHLNCPYPPARATGARTRSPCTVAGGPLASDVVKCRLTPFDEGGHPAEFDAEQAERAGEVFAAGVCDWSVPGVDQRPPKGPWQFF